MTGPNHIGSDSPPGSIALAPQPGIASLEDDWDELHRRGVRIAQMAALSREPFAGRLAEFPLAIRRQIPSRINLAVNAIGDLLAITEPGLAALHAIAGRGQDVTAPALALWREFYAAREAVMALAFDE